MKIESVDDGFFQNEDTKGDEDENLEEQCSLQLFESKEEAKELQVRAEGSEEEERDFGLSDWRTWVLWYKNAGVITFTLGTFLALAIDRGFYVGNKWWLSSWTSAETETIRSFGITFAAKKGLSVQLEFVKYYCKG